MKQKINGNPVQSKMTAETTDPTTNAIAIEAKADTNPENRSERKTLQRQFGWLIILICMHPVLCSHD